MEGKKRRTGMLSHEMIYAKIVIYYQNKHREDYSPWRRNWNVPVRESGKRIEECRRCCVFPVPTDPLESWSPVSSPRPFFPNPRSLKFILETSREREMMEKMWPGMNQNTFLGGSFFCVPPAFLAALSG